MERLEETGPRGAGGAARTEWFSNHDISICAKRHTYLTYPVTNEIDFYFVIVSIPPPRLAPRARTCVNESSTSLWRCGLWGAKSVGAQHICRESVDLRGYGPHSKPKDQPKTSGQPPDDAKSQSNPSQIRRAVWANLVSTYRGFGGLCVCSCSTRPNYPSFRPLLRQHALCCVLL